jgi:hypothetical protein
LRNKRKVKKEQLNQNYIKKFEGQD